MHINKDHWGILNIIEILKLKVSEQELICWLAPSISWTVVRNKIFQRFNPNPCGRSLRDEDF